MENEILISDSVKRQCMQIFQNIDILFSEISSEDFNKRQGGFFIWKQFYHMIHSIDKNFIDPSIYQEPNIHIKNLDVIYMDDDNIMSKEKIENYYNEVKNKILMYLNKINDESLKCIVNYKDME